MGWRAWFGWLALVLGSSACLGSEQEQKKQGNRLSACASGASEAEIQDNIYVTEEYAVALANSLTIGWLPTLFAIDFLLQFDRALRDASNGQLPEWSHHDGVYSHQGEYAGVDLRVSTTTDSEYGPAGTPVVQDLLKLDSYFLGANATLDPSDDSIRIEYTEPGPLIGLLGLGESPDNPLTLSAAERAAIVSRMGTLELSPEYTANAHTPYLLWDFLLTSPSATFAELSVGDFSLEMRLIAVNASRPDLEQTLKTKVWDVKSQGGITKGYTTFDVSGGYFPYQGRITFTPVATPFVIVYPERKLDCP